MARPPGICCGALGNLHNFKVRPDLLSTTETQQVVACPVSSDVIITFEQCAVFAGLAPNEMILGATPSRKHHSLLLSYLLNRKRGPERMRKMIVADIRASLDIGAPKMAADLLVVLRWFLSDYPEARSAPEKLGNCLYGDFEVKG